MKIYVLHESDEQYEYGEQDDGTLTIARYIGKEKDASVPAMIDGRTVTHIGSRAFAGCSSLAHIRIPSSVTDIEKSAFEGCDRLTILSDENSYAWKFALGMQKSD